jgi:hypothetical protein
MRKTAYVKAEVKTLKEGRVGPFQTKYDRDYVFLKCEVLGETEYRDVYNHGYQRTFLVQLLESGNQHSKGDKLLVEERDIYFDKHVERW